MAIVDVDDASFLKLLRGRTPDVVKGRPSEPVDLVFMGARELKDLKRLTDVKGWIEPSGAIWVVRAKGGRSEIRDTDIIEAGLADSADKADQGAAKPTFHFFYGIGLWCIDGILVATATILSAIVSRRRT